MAGTPSPAQPQPHRPPPASAVRQSCPSSPTSSAPARAARVRSTRARRIISVRAALPCSRGTTSTGAAVVAARLVARPRADDVALSRGAAGVRRRAARHARRRLHAAVPRHAPGRDARSRPPLHQGRVAEPDQLVQGARAVHGGDACACARRARRSRSRPPGTQAPRSPPTPRVPGSRRACSCRATSSRRLPGECELYGAHLTLVDGLITDAGRAAAEQGAPLGWYDVSTLKEPYRLEGKKTMGYELAEQLEWRLPDWIVYPTGGGTGLIGMWKAFEELEALGWMPAGGRPRMVTVQAEGCAPIVQGVRAGSGSWRRDRSPPDGGRWVARASGGRRLPDAPRAAREPRRRDRRERRGDGRRDAPDRRQRGCERRARKAAPRSWQSNSSFRRAGSAALISSCCSTPAAR